MAIKSISELIVDLQSDNLETRRDAAWALAEYGEAAREALPALRDSFKDDDWAVRKLSLLALGRILESDFESEAINALENDPNNEVKAGAIETLAEFGSEKAVPALLKAAKSDYQTVREMAPWALGKLGKKSSIAITSLIDLLLTSNPFEQKIVGWALGEIGAVEAVDPLIKVIEESTLPEVKASLAFSLAKLDDKDKGIAYLLEMKEKNELTYWEIQELDKLTGKND